MADPVLLVNMPLSPADRPSLGLTLLAEVLKREGIGARVLYPNLDFRDAIGGPLYDSLSLNRLANTSLAGEWIFSRLVCPSGDAESYIRHLAGLLEPSDDVAALVEALPGLVTAAAALVEAVADAVEHSGARVVGFSSCYNQHLPSLAAAHRIKQRCPDCFVVLGGVNCIGPAGPETLRRFAFLDAVVAGPGEIALPALVRQVLAGRRDLDMAGVYLRGADGRLPVSLEEGLAPEPPLDELPYPDFSDFFAHPRAGAVITMEGSRGCWWGQKNHCVFCSENGQSLRFRHKSPQRFLDELRWLTARHPGCRVALTDEILDRRLLAEAIPRLAEAPLPAGGFISVKANLRKAEVAALAAAGFDRLQPGIESLDDAILAPMRKGVAAIRNVQLLKWCREHGLAVTWGLLFGFPFDPPDAYRRMVELLPALSHLPSPGLTQVVLQRHSPLVREAERFGLRGVQPSGSYRFLYPFPPEVLAALAYRFIADGPDDTVDWRPLKRAVAAWRQAAGAVLFHHDEGDRLLLCDTRPATPRFLHVLRGVERAVYLACDAAQPLQALQRTIPAAPAEIAAAIDGLMAARLLMADKGLHLALGWRLNRRSLPPPDVMARFAAAR